MVGWGSEIQPAEFQGRALAVSPRSFQMGFRVPQAWSAGCIDPSIQGVADRPTQDSYECHLHSPQLCRDVFVHFLRTAVHDLALSEPWKIENSKILFSKYS